MPIAPIKYKPEEFTGFRSWREVRRPEEDYLSTLLRWGGENVGQLLNLVDPGMISGMMSMFRVPNLRLEELIRNPRFVRRALLKQVKPELRKDLLRGVEYTPEISEFRPWEKRIRVKEMEALPHELAHAVSRKREYGDAVLAWSEAPAEMRSHMLRRVIAERPELSPNKQYSAAIDELYAHLMSAQMNPHLARWVSKEPRLIEAVTESERAVQQAPYLSIKDFLRRML